MSGVGGMRNPFFGAVRGKRLLGDLGLSNVEGAPFCVLKVCLSVGVVKILGKFKRVSGLERERNHFG